MENITNRPRIGFVDLFVNLLLLRGPKRLEEVADEFELRNPESARRLNQRNNPSVAATSSKEHRRTHTKPSDLVANKLPNRSFTTPRRAVAANRLALELSKKRKGKNLLGRITQITTEISKISGASVLPIVRVQIKGGREVSAYLASNFSDLDENTLVVIRKARIGSVPNVHYKVVHLIGEIP